MKKCYCIVFGAKVKPNGEPSGAILRRVNAAFLICQAKPECFYITSGAVGEGPISEARVMKNLLLQLGTNNSQIIMDEKSTDTLSSIFNSSKILRDKNDFDKIYVASDIYHIPRIRWLFYLWGIKTYPASVESGLPKNGILKWSYFYFRELFAIPFDTLLILFFRIRK